MDVKTFRAKSMHDALSRVREELGPDAAVLHTREVSGGGLFRWFTGSKQIEVTASTSVHVPSRFEYSDVGSELDITDQDPDPDGRALERDVESRSEFEAAVYRDNEFRDRLRDGLGTDRSSDLESLVAGLEQRPSPSRELPESMFHLFTDLIDAELDEDIARELIDRARGNGEGNDDIVLLKSRIARMLEDELLVCGPIRVTPGVCRRVSLVGPTGVGKTTTIAKLAANFRLRDNLRVGLITVDTYRIAAVEQLRTYADIIDLPMEIVSTPQEMREAVERLSDLDLVLMDTAGRSPRDEVKIQELRSMLAEARADEVHLVLSSVSSLPSMKKAAERFAHVGATSLILTKLDEATGLGNLLPLMRCCRLPMSYVTNGQNVPDDIEAADRRQMARRLLGVEQ